MPVPPAGGTGSSSLCYPAGVPKHVPLVVHAAGGHSLYEEPLIACVALTVEAVHCAPLGSASLPVLGIPEGTASPGHLARDTSLGGELAAAGQGEGADVKPSKHSSLGRFLPSPFRKKGAARYATRWMSSAGGLFHKATIFGGLLPPLPGAPPPAA